jgi:hypothetical protein
MGELRQECERRFEILENSGTRNLREHHQHGGNLPYLVVFVDEWASFSSEDHFNEQTLFLARMGRAAGISLVLATQRPSARVVDPDVRALAGAAVAFRCRTAHDSRTILGDSGAEELPRLPGRCIVSTGEFLIAQAYCCGLEGGRFDRFVQSLPRGKSSGTGVSAWSERPPVATGGATTGSEYVRPTSWPPVEHMPGVTEGNMERIERGRVPTSDQAALMHRLYHHGGYSLNRLCERFYGYKDTTVLAFVREAVEYKQGHRDH